MTQVKLLVAGKESPSRDAVRWTFAKSGYSVEVAGSGLECLSKLRSFEPDVIVADLEMPWGGATSVVAFVNESCFEFKVPIFIITGRARSEVLSDCTNVPITRCFQKPVRMRSLLHRVESLVNALADPGSDEFSSIGHRWGDGSAGAGTIFDSDSLA